MEVQLNVLDRLTLVSILPTTGRLQELVEVLDIVKLVKFSEEEKKSIGYKEVDGKVSWDPSKEVLKTFEFTFEHIKVCLLYTSPSPRDRQKSRMPSSA